MLKKPGRRLSDADVAARRAHVYQRYLLGWDAAERRRLCDRYGVRERQLYQDVEVVRAESRQRLDPGQRESARELLLAQLERVKGIAAKALECRICQGSGIFDGLDCGECVGTGVILEADARWGRVLVQAVEAAAKLTGLSSPPPQVVVTVQTASPAQLLADLEAQLGTLSRTGIGALPVLDVEPAEVE